MGKLVVIPILSCKFHGFLVAHPLGYGLGIGGQREESVFRVYWDM